MRVDPYEGKFNQASPPTRIYRSHSCLLGGKNISRVDIRSYRRGQGSVHIRTFHLAGFYELLVTL